MKYTVLLSLSAVLLLGAFLFAYAQSSDPTKLAGTAFSRNIGLLQFQGVALNGDPYGVRYDAATGMLSGYAWSEYIGWVKFDPDPPFPAIAGSESFSARNDGGKLKGWVRACAVFQSGCSGTLKPSDKTGDWDGWISLSGMALNGDLYFVDTATMTNVSGWAWGNMVPGWVDFNGSFFANDTGCMGSECGSGTSTPPCVGSACGGGSTSTPGALTVLLSANPRSGRLPSVGAFRTELTARVDGDSRVTSFNYKFDCDNNGSYEVVNLNISSREHTATCAIYTKAANYTALVYVEDAASSATPAMNTTLIRVLPRGPYEAPPR